jgi:phosphate transport system protein
MRQSFDQKLTALQQQVLNLGYATEAILAEAASALVAQDLPRAHQVINTFRTLTRQQIAIEAETLSLMAMQQPVAGDLRTLVALLEISSELEHMSQYAASLAQAVIILGQEKLLEPFQKLILAMAQAAGDMLGQSLAALAQKDVPLARLIPPQDDRVDQLYQAVYHELTVAVQANPQVASQATLVNRVAHNLERTADRVINICEWVIFALTGEKKELNVPTV